MADPGLSPGLSPQTYQATYAPFTPSDSGQRSHPPYYRGCWHGVSRCFLTRYRQVGIIRYSSRATEVYTPKSVIPHAASLRQPLGHCAIFPTAASRRSLGRISVPMWLVILSDQLPVVALVSHYLTNKLIGREPLIAPISRFIPKVCTPRIVCGITRPLGRLCPTLWQVAHVLRTRSPVALAGPRDLHVLCTPPAFVLSQDQTLQ